MSYDDDLGEEKEFRMDADDDADLELGEDMEGMHFEDEDSNDPEDRFS